MRAKLSPPTPSLYAPLHSYIPAPEDNTNTFHDICDNKVVFRSLDTNTHLTVAVAITDED